MLELEIATAKISKYASSESGDTFELVERPGDLGGFTAVLVDGQGSGKNAKNVSNYVAAQAVAQLKQGVRDGVVARAVSDHLRSYRSGKVSAALTMLSVDLISRTLVVTRNTTCPVWVVAPPAPADTSEDEEVNTSTEYSLNVLNQPSEIVGIYPRTRPHIVEFELTAGLVAVAITDGILTAGERWGTTPPDIALFLKENIPLRPDFGAQALADAILQHAISADRARPQDDMAVVVIALHSTTYTEDNPQPRRLHAKLFI